jgi:hypothetical protein
MAVPAMDGTMAASYLTMRGQKWMIGQHDDRFYHRRRWERSERIGDAVMIASGV